MVNRTPVIAVIGAGIAGLEAARQLKDLGYKPVLIEKAPVVGGHVAEWNRLFPDLSPAADLVQFLSKGAGSVKTYTDTEIASMGRLKDGYSLILSNGETLLCDAVLFATGFHLFDASKKEEYGYGIYDRVITNRDLEQWFNNRHDPRVANPKAKGVVVHGRVDSKTTRKLERQRIIVVLGEKPPGYFLSDCRGHHIRISAISARPNHTAAVDVLVANVEPKPKMHLGGRGVRPNRLDVLVA